MVSAEASWQATLDADLRLRDADASLRLLNERAGGGEGEPLAIPAVARLARLSQRLGIAVDRVCEVADESVDMDVWAEVRPVADGFDVAVTVLRERDPWRPASATVAIVPPPGGDYRWETDAALRVIHVDADNPHAIDPAAALGRSLTDLFSLSPAESGAMPLMEAIAAGGTFTEQPAVVAAIGARVLLQGAVRTSRSGAFAGIVGASVTLPDLPQDEAVVPDADASGFPRELDRILRAPLGRIVANADSINARADGPLDEHYADYAADIASAARHLLGLIDDLADLEAIERDDVAAEVEPTDLADVARRAVGLLNVRAADAGVAIDWQQVAGPMTALADFRRALQILVNLLTNALRYSARGGTVWVRLGREGDQVVTIVADQGKGIAPEDQARIFDKFERVDPSEPGGTGLGLYISRRLARAMGGDLVVDSAAGAGARFILSLPAA